jgi:hypothetical protein
LIIIRWYPSHGANGFQTNHSLWCRVRKLEQHARTIERSIPERATANILNNENEPPMTTIFITIGGLFSLQRETLKTGMTWKPSIVNADDVQASQESFTSPASTCGIYFWGFLAVVQTSPEASLQQTNPSPSLESLNQLLTIAWHTNLEGGISASLRAAFPTE